MSRSTLLDPKTGKQRLQTCLFGYLERCFGNFELRVLLGYRLPYFQGVCNFFRNAYARLLDNMFLSHSQWVGAGYL